MLMLMYAFFISKIPVHSFDVICMCMHVLKLSAVVDYFRCCSLWLTYPLAVFMFVVIQPQPLG